MESSTASNAPGRHQNSPRRPLAYRVRSGGDHGRVIQPTSAKYTIGSMSDCSVAVVGEGVRPVHCMVIHGPRRTIVRRWGPDSHLNGLTYDDASLVVGDRLRIGEVELEIVAGAPSDVSNQSDLSDRSDDAFPSQPPTCTDESHGARSLDAVQSQQSRDVERRLRRRSRRLLAALRHERSLRTDVEQDLGTANDDYHVLIKRLAALDATRSSERSEWRQKVSELEAESKRLQRLCTTLEKERDDVNQRLAATGQTAKEVERNKREAEFSARAKCHELEWQLEEMRAAADAERESFYRQRTEWSQQEAERRQQEENTEAQLHHTIAEKNQQIEQLTSDAAALADEIESVRRERDRAQEDSRAASVIPALKEELRQLNEECSKSQIKWDEERRAWQETHQKEEEEATERNQSFRVAEHFLREDLAQKEAEISALQSRIAEIEAAVQTAQSDQANAREAAKSLTEELAERDAKLEKLTEQLADREKHFDAQRQSWEEERTRESEKLREDQRTATEEAERLRRELAEQVETATELAEQLDEVRRYASSLQDRLTSVEEASANSQEELQSRETKLADLHSQIKTLREALAAAADEPSQSAAAELAERDAQVRELTEQLAAHEQQLADDRNAWDEERRVLSEQSQAAQQAAAGTEASLRAALSDQIEKADELTGELDEVRRYASSLQDRLTCLEEDSPHAQQADPSPDPELSDLNSQTAEEVAPEAVFEAPEAVFETPEDVEEAPEVNEALELDAPPAEADPKDTEAAIEHLRALNIWQQEEDDSSAAAGSTSYIERFSSMFEDERSDEGSPIEGGCRDSDLGSGAGNGMPESAMAEATVTPVEIHDDEEPPAETDDGSASVFADDSEVDEEDDEESLQSYLARLAERVRGEPMSPSSQSAAVQQTQSAGVSESDLPGQSSIGAPPEALVRLEDIKRDGVIPERSGDFEGMRRLANDSARDAIGVHDSRAKRNRMLNKVLAAAVGLLCGIWVISAAPAWLSLQTVLGIGVAAAGIYWTGQTLGLLLEAVRRGTLDEAESVQRVLPESPSEPSMADEDSHELRDESLNSIV